jgi:ferritin-like metal-binding protein YciE
MTKKQVLIKWLNDAVGMEEGIIETLEEHAKDAREEGLGKVESMIEKHIQETKDQSERIQTCIEELGGEVSGGKSKLSEIVGKVSGMMSEPAEDKVIKNALSEHATEHFEIASYMAIEEAARECGEDRIARVARDIIEEEIKTSEMIKENLPMLVREHLAKMETE